MMNKIGLYIHIPFCHKICSYCDFVKRVSKEARIIEYIDLLIKEIEIYKNNGFDFTKIKTIYIGGGTPSILNKECLIKLFNCIFQYINVDNLEEFTFEFNPEDLNPEIIDLLASYNVNRVSIGIQTFSERLLSILNRSFDVEVFLEHYRYLKRKIPNVNFDLMYAIPTQTVEELEETILRILALKPTHLSLYSLILEPNTLFEYKLKRGEIKLCDEKLEMAMVDKVNKLLFPTYSKYEVSNYCLENYQSKHNLIYWLNEQYLGIGVAAASYIDQHRYNNTHSLKQYKELLEEDKLPIEAVEELSILDEKKYHLIMGFRLTKGIDIVNYRKRFNSEIIKDFPKILEFIKDGYMNILNDFIFIKDEYFYVMNHLLEQLI